MIDVIWFETFQPSDDLEQRGVEFVGRNNNFDGDDVRALLRRVDRLRAELVAERASHSKTEKILEDASAQLQENGLQIAGLFGSVEGYKERCARAEYEPSRATAEARLWATRWRDTYVHTGNRGMVPFLDGLEFRLPWEDVPHAEDANSARESNQ